MCLRRNGGQAFDPISRPFGRRSFARKVQQIYGRPNGHFKKG
jgi:hypothetical protein